MTQDTLEFLKRLLDTPGPSGFETAPARVWRDHVKGFTDQVTSDVHGNSVAALNPKGTPRLMLAGHIDRSEEHTSNSSHSQISYAVFCLKKKNTHGPKVLHLLQTQETVTLLLSSHRHGVV